MKQEETFVLTPSYRKYALALFLLVYIINFIDRQIFSILIEPIRTEIELSDTQLGLVGGVAFAIFYTFAGIPIARWADVGVRKNIVALAIVIWSAMTMFTATAKGFGGLLIARIGVGVGEAGCSPPIHSLISDYYPEEKRATALGTYALGIPIGAAIGTLVGGWIGEYFGWRMAFLVVGVPGIIVAAVFYLTIKEPPRGFSEPDGVLAEKDTVPLGETLRFMWSLKSFRHLSLIGLTGMIGTYLGGYLGDRFGREDKRWYMGIPGFATFLGVPFGFIFYTTSDPFLAIILAIPGYILGPMYLAPTFAITQTLVTPAMRSLASAILLFVLNIIGLGLGPVFAGFLSDTLKPEYGEESIRYSLLFLVIAGNVWSTLHYYLASKTLREDLTAKDRISQVGPANTEM